MILTIGQVNISYEELGSGVPLLCLPAFPFDHRMWSGQHALQDVARLILPDYRGTGRSSATEGPTTMGLLANDMFMLLDSLGIERAVIMGVSMGIYTAFAMYEQRPERFRGFVIADTRAEADNPEQAERRKKTVIGLRREGIGILRERVNDLFSPSIRRENPDLIDEMQAQVKEQSPEGLAQITMGMAMRPDRVNLLPQISVPTLVLCGAEDTVSPPDGMRKLAAAIPGARFQLIPRAGHMSPLEQPSVFNQYIREFLAEVAR